MLHLALKYNIIKKKIIDIFWTKSITYDIVFDIKNED